MSAVQNPPVTVITVPPETTTTTTAPTTTTTTTAPVTTVAEAPATTTVATTQEPAAPVDPGQPEEGLVLVVFLGLAALGALVFLLVREFRGRRYKPAPVVIPAAGVTVADRVRAAAAKAELDGPGGSDPLSDVSVADLYPWLDSPEDLTLVVDLRTAEALQGVGVTSLTQLADIDDDMVRAIVDAGIDIDTRAVEAAAQDILGRRAKGEID